ncbi:HAD hydrolase, family IA [Propionibacterium sp. oral taxon 192 str. F0372]|uniref:HAD-IA family hydrolase n=1 Tax=Propionibacterium sp. oral taxon 192 TaxID=671222 RepID=UPI000352FDD3|nr:HAD-IA family hydrolase [Propionibacterium sp. oral taxon 192]EPH06220.1 HAD hydrolase, family IA [Propionibacterium sp. oral taxon 192 str. F0372]
MSRILVLDAMGVIYRSADDVAELLIPFVRAKDCILSAAEIKRHYRAASLGRMTSDELWLACGLPQGLDEEYCQRHELMPGITDLVQEAAAHGLRVTALTNDISAWSRRLRGRFGLDEIITDWVVSADIAVRKPDPRAFSCLLERVGCDAGDVLFFDDRYANVDAARHLGIDAHEFVGVEEARTLVGVHAHPRTSVDQAFGGWPT